jgi:hypothetical protein
MPNTKQCPDCKTIYTISIKIQPSAHTGDSPGEFLVEFMEELIVVMLNVLNISILRSRIPRLISSGRNDKHEVNQMD